VDLPVKLNLNTQQDFICNGKVLGVDFIICSGNTLINWDKIVVHFFSRSLTDVAKYQMYC